MIKLTQTTFDKQFINDPNLVNDLDDRRKWLMLQDIYYNIDNLKAAITHDSEQLIVEYIN
ncbi:MAG: Cobalamin B12-binding domain protein [Clostridiales bacterium 38_11]|nr:MAG: Cobalamin B12-binding domain protein [Clostridiales bacterium 38_11]